jgi:uncharacterized protein YidB (DUF937 family)
MSRGFPSMTALLGLLAVAGYQNRDKLAEMLGSRSNAQQPGQQPGHAPRTVPATGASEGIMGTLGNLQGALGGMSIGTLLSGGLGELVERFKQAGQEKTVNSWVNTGPNLEVSSTQLEQAIGQQTLEQLEQQTGMSKKEIISRLSRELPEAVDKYTPEGRIPTENEFKNV